MGNWIRLALWRLVRRWAVRQPEAAFIFTRADGVEAEVDCCACGQCKNYFWIQHAFVDPPRRCPYCERQFSGIVPVSKDEFDKIQVL